MNQQPEHAGESFSASFSTDLLRELHQNTINPATGKPYSVKALARLCNQNERIIGPTQVWKILNGKASPKLPKDRPVVEAFARVFGVSAAEFYPDLPPQRAAEWKLAETFRRNEVQQVALRQLAETFPEGHQQSLLEALEAVVRGFEARVQHNDGDDEAAHDQRPPH